MVTRAQRPDGMYAYACDVCDAVNVVKFSNLKNPCQCPPGDIEIVDVEYVGGPDSPAVEQADPRRLLSEPSLPRRAANYAKAGALHLASGRPLAADKQVAERFAICQACPLFKPKDDGQGVCTHSSCGCALKAVGVTGRNKLRWADSQCPLGKWNAAPAE